MTARRWLLLLASLTLLAYARTVTFGWIFDDPSWLPLGMHRAPTPLLRVFGVAEWIGRGSPWPYHALVVLAHLLNGWLFYRLSRRVVSEPVALCATGLFWLHPMQVAAVAYVTGGREVVITTAVLLAIEACLAPRWIVAFGLTLLAATAKPSALPSLVLVPFAAVVLSGQVIDWRRWSGWANALLWLLQPVALMWVLATPAGFTERMQFVGLTLTAAVRYVAYVIPWGLQVDHAWDTVPPIVHLLCVSGVVVVLIELIRREAWRLLAAVVWVLLPIVARGLFPQPQLPPASQVLTLSHLYLPALGLWLIVASGLVSAWSRVFLLQRSESACV